MAELKSPTMENVVPSFEPVMVAASVPVGMVEKLPVTAQWLGAAGSGGAGGAGGDGLGPP